MLDRFAHDVGLRVARERAHGRGASQWLKPQRLEYLPLDEELAVVRLVAELRSGFSPPVGATLVVDGPDWIRKSCQLGSLSHRIPRRFRAADELLWRVTFALPLELVEFPEATFSLMAQGHAAARLPDPTLATLAALSEPWPLGPRGALLLSSGAWRRAAALGTVIAVAGSSSVSPALAIVGHSAPGQSGPVRRPPAVTAVLPSSSDASSAGNPTATHTPGPASGSFVHAAAVPGEGNADTRSLVGHKTTSADRPRSAKRSAAHGTSDSTADSARAASSVRTRVTLSAHPTPATRAGTSGTDPGSAQAAPPSAAALLALAAARLHDKTTQIGIARRSGRVSALTSVPRGSQGTGPQVSVGTAVGDLPQGRHREGSSSSGRPGHGTVPVKGAHPLGSGGGRVARPKPGEPPESSAPSTSNDTVGAIPFGTGAGANTAVSSLFSRLAGVYSQTDQPPPFLIPIYKKAGAKFHIPWDVLAAINSVETDYGRNVNTSSAGAIGWMQFMPSTWAQYGMAIDHSGPPNPYNPADAIFSAARYLAANGGGKNLRQAIYAYNHAQWYVDEVLLRAQLIGSHTQGGLTNPFPLGWVPNRLDMGYDGTFTGAIVAPFPGTITYAAKSFSNWGGYLELKADHPIPGLPSDTLYFAEGLAPAVKAGEHVTAGQLIALPAPSPYGDAYNTTVGGAGQIEWGLASPGLLGSPTNPLAESGVSRPANVVIAFAIWVVKNLGLAPPSQTSNAGYP